VWWLDIERPRLQSIDPRTGQYAMHAFAANSVGSVAFRDDGKFLVALDNALHIFDPETSTLAPFLEVEGPNRGTRLNDGRCDHHGRLWIGTMDETFQAPLGSLYRVDPDGSVVRMFADIVVTNSITTS